MRGAFSGPAGRRMPAGHTADDLRCATDQIVAAAGIGTVGDALVFAASLARQADGTHPGRAGGSGGH